MCNYLDLSTNTYEANEDDFPGLVNVAITFDKEEVVKTYPIALYDDIIPESEERFYLILSNPNLAINPDRNNATVWINDDDGKTVTSMGTDL